MRDRVKVMVSDRVIGRVMVIVRVSVRVRTYTMVSVSVLLG